MEMVDDIADPLRALKCEWQSGEEIEWPFEFEVSCSGLEQPRISASDGVINRNISLQRRPWRPPYHCSSATPKCLDEVLCPPALKSCSACRRLHVARCALSLGPTTGEIQLALFHFPVEFVKIIYLVSYMRFNT
mgnify:CR=1 FL=1